jgi:hypothetical protein
MWYFHATCFDMLSTLQIETILFLTSHYSFRIDTLYKEVITILLEATQFVSLNVTKNCVLIFVISITFS